MKYLSSQMVSKCIAFTAVILFASACATDISSKSYSEDSVGEASQTYSGVVMKTRSVKVAPDQLGKNYVGAVAGGVTGGLVGSQLASGFGGSMLTLGLAGAGAIGGASIEKSLRTQQAFEITVRLQSGELRTIVQGNDIAFKKGERILLLIYTRGRCKVVKEDDEGTTSASL